MCLSVCVESITGGNLKKCNAINSDCAEAYACVYVQVSVCQTHAAGVGSHGFKSLQGYGACFLTIDGFGGGICAHVCEKKLISTQQCF